MGPKYLIGYLILMITLIIGAGSSLGQLTSSNYDYLGTPVYYSDTQHLPGMQISQPVYGASYPSSYYTSQVDYTGGDWLGTPVYYSDTRHLPGTSLSQPAYVTPLAPSYYVTGPSGLSNSGPFAYNAGMSLTGFALTGRVVDQYGNGIAGAQVILTNINEAGTFTTTTNSLGYYGINAPDGVYYVTANIPGYSFSRSTGRITTGYVSPAPNVIGYKTSGGVVAGYGQAAYGSQTAAQTQSSAYGTQTTAPSAGYYTWYA